MTSSQPGYQVEVHRTVRRFLRNHRELADNWDDIRLHLARFPRRGGRVNHLKARWHCDYRWRQGRYRLLYEIIDAENIVHIYHANTRGDVYR